MASEKAVKFATTLLAETGEAGLATAAAYVPGFNPEVGVTEEDGWKPVSNLIDALLALKKTLKAEALVDVPPAPLGTGVVTAVVTSIKEKEGTYGPYLGVVAETAIGNKVWFIAPKGFTAAVGEEIAVEGEWKRAEDDLHFSFGKKVKIPAPALV